MKNIVVTVLLCFVFCLMTSYSFAAKPKYKTLYLSNQTLYEGYCLKKKPAGTGKLYFVSHNQYNGKNSSDELSGVFDNNLVDSATLNLSSGFKYTGKVRLDITDEGITYILYKGTLNGKFDVVNGCDERMIPYTVNIRDSFMITHLALARDYNSDFDYSPAVVYDTIVTEILPTTKDAKNRTFFGVPYEALISFADNADGMWLYEKCEINFAINRFVRGKENWFDFKNGITGIYTDKKILVTKENGDSLYDCIQKGDDWYHEDDIVIKRTFNEGVAFYRHKAGEKTIPYYEEISKLMGNELHERYDKIRHKGDESRPFNGGNRNLITIEYNNGDRFRGLIYEHSWGAYDPINLIASLPSINNDTIFYNGVMTHKDGTKSFWDRGHTLEFLEAESQRIEEVEKERLRRKDAREQEERRLQREKELNERKPLYEKYGKKYVDALFDDDEILIGTPEGLVKNHTKSSVVSENEYTIKYKIDGIFQKWVKTVVVDRKTRRVTSITNW